MKRILITGHNGFVGTHLVNHLFSKKNKIIGVSNHIKKNNILQIKDDIRYITHNKIPNNVDCIIHLAALTDVNYCQKNPKNCFAVNVAGTLNMLEIAREKSAKFIFVSTSHVFGVPKKIPIKEDHPKNPNSIYAASKLAGEILAESYAITYNMNVSIVRLFSVYGPASSSHLVTTRIISQILNGNKVRLGNLRPKRDFVHVYDAVSAIETVMKKSKNFNSFNIGTGKSYSISKICNTLAKISGKKITIQSVKSHSRRNDAKNIVSNPAKIKKLGWRPKLKIEEGLHQTYDWFVRK